MLESLAHASIMESAADMSVMETISDENAAQLMAVMLESELSDDELDEFMEEFEAEVDDLPVTEAIVMERSIVKLDKRAKKNKAYKMSVLQVAKEMNLPSFKKIVTLWKMERFLWNDMEKKCGTKARTRMKSMHKKTEESHSNAVKKIADKLTRSEKHTKEARTAKRAPSKLTSQTNTVMKQIEKKLK